MTKESKQYILAILISDIDDKRACLHVLGEELKEARIKKWVVEADNINFVRDRIETSLRAAERAMEEFLNVDKA